MRMSRRLEGGSWTWATIIFNLFRVSVEADRKEHSAKHVVGIESRVKKNFFMLLLPA